MRKSTVSAWGLTLAAAAYAHAGVAGTINFTPLTPTSVTAGTSISAFVEMEAPDPFDLTNILIGAPGAVTDLTFVTDPAWNLAFQSGFSSVSYDEFAGPTYAQNVFLIGDVAGAGTVSPSLDLGMLTIDTAGMAPGAYAVGVSINDSYTINQNEGGEPHPLVTTGLAFIVIPEPASGLLLTLGAVVVRRRRRPAA